MRLSSDQVFALKKSCIKWFGSDIQLWLFGSRADDLKRGGDIDLCLQTKKTDIDEIILAKFNCLVEIQMCLGEQKIDLIIIYPDSTLLPIYNEIFENGVKLI